MRYANRCEIFTAYAFIARLQVVGNIASLVPPLMIRVICVEEGVEYNGDLKKKLEGINGYNKGGS